VSKSLLFFFLLLSFAFVSSANSTDLKKYGPIKDGDSLWAIAKLLRPDDSFSVARMMRVLFTYNPQAFINGNIDRLKKGAIVRVPDHLVSSSSPEGIKRPESTTQSSQTSSATPSRRASVLEKPDSLKANSIDAKQKTPVQIASGTDLKAKIAALLKNNAAKDHEIASLRRDLMSLRKAGLASKSVVNASNTYKIQPLDSTGQGSSKPSIFRSEQIKSEPRSSGSGAGTARDLLTSERSKPEFSNSNIAVIKIILIVGLGSGTFALVLGMSILWYRRAVSVKSKVEPSEKTLGEAQPSSHPAKHPGVHPIKLTTELLTTADSELAKGNVQQAKAMLQQALARDPHRADIKLRVMRIQSAQKRQQESENSTSKSPSSVPLNLGATTALKIMAQKAEAGNTEISDYGAKRKVSESFKQVLQKMETWRAVDEVDYSDIDEAETKLELARAYIDKGDLAYAQSILSEVILEGTRIQQEYASNLIVQCKTRMLKLG
jgi:FimV-like protein